MTAAPDVETRAPAAAQPGGHPAYRWAPGVLTAAAGVAALLGTGTPALDVARYAAYLGWAVLLPGTLVYRSLRGRPRTLLDDLALGAATGFALELAGWALYSAAGLQSWLWTWPALVVVTFAAVPELRRHWRLPAYPQRVPAVLAWAIAGIAIVATGHLALTYFAVNPLPPASGQPTYYQDLLFHLALAGEAKHHLALQAPQTAGVPLLYHWFADAHLAAASQISGVELATVLLRLYLLPIVLAGIGLIVTAGWRLSGRLLAGVVAAAVTFAAGELDLFPSSQPLFGTVYDFTVWASPSMTYSYLTLIPLVLLIGEFFRGERSWALTGLFLLAAGGAKSTTIPVLLGGIGVAGAYLLVRRRFGAPLLILASAVAAAQLAAIMLLFGGSSYGTTIDPLSAITTTRIGQSVLHGHHGVKAAVLVVGLAALWSVTVLARLAGVAVLARTALTALRTRRGAGPVDVAPGPAVVQLFLAGCLLAGAAAALVLGHPGGSQFYFLKAGWIPGAILSGWGLAELVAARPLSRRLSIALAALIAGGAAVIVAAAPFTVPGGLGAEALARASIPAAALAVAGLTGAALWLIARGQRPGLRGAGPAIALVAILAAGLPAQAIKYTPLAEGVAAGKIPASSPTGTPASQVDAGRWLRAHSGPDDVVATNSHCRPPGRPGRCDARSFWVGAFSERRVLVEGWGYNNRMQAKGNHDGYRYSEWPFWDAGKLAANDRVFTGPDAASAGVLRREFGVRWLVADTGAGTVSPRLAGLATERFHEGTVTVYELR